MTWTDDHGTEPDPVEVEGHTNPYPFQFRDRVTHPSRPGIVGTLDPPEYVFCEREPRYYVFWDDGQGSRVDPRYLAYAAEPIEPPGGP